MEITLTKSTDGSESHPYLGWTPLRGEPSEISTNLEKRFRMLAAVAETKNDECWLITGYWA